MVERKNRTIVESAKVMIHDQNLHSSFWAEASRTAVYIQNRCPHNILGNKSPEEAFTRVKPDISHLRIFGCPVYIHIPKDKRSKLEPLGKKGIFVGYNETSKAYRIYILGQKLIELSRDVIFEEDVAFRKSKDIHEIDIEDQEPPQSMKEDHTLEIQRETRELVEAVNPNEPLDPTDGPIDIVVN